MYGILAACIAAMAMFLALFAVSVEPVADDNTSGKLAVESVQTVPLTKVSTQ
jgi:hypothetical protein